MREGKGAVGGGEERVDSSFNEDYLLEYEGGWGVEKRTVKEFLRRCKANVLCIHETKEEKRQLWDDLIQHHFASIRLWCMAGEFNAEATPWERIGNMGFTGDMEDFSSGDNIRLFKEDDFYRSRISEDLLPCLSAEEEVISGLVSEIEVHQAVFSLAGSFGMVVRKMQGMAWGRVVVSKEEGGLGLKNIRDFNLALLCKWLQRLGGRGSESTLAKGTWLSFGKIVGYVVGLLDLSIHGQVFLVTVVDVTKMKSQSKQNVYFIVTYIITNSTKVIQILDEMTQEEREIKQNLFENQQQQLECNVERLSKSLMEPFDELSEEEILRIRMNIINLSVLVDQLCHKMYECIENDLLGALRNTTHNIAPYRSKGIERASELTVRCDAEPTLPSMKPAADDSCGLATGNDIGASESGRSSSAWLFNGSSNFDGNGCSTRMRARKDIFGDALFDLNMPPDVPEKRLKI
ncbi:hypothetical protein Taro_025840 [Colocasia esculenta]|uniref:Ariadne domain-containing protein n=1 Tax=Colocasia esculenta TaxID=4460 RepID=A0A843VHR6_COLES|nr:hypothetical protein [Colocasia esculenta]